MEKEKLVESFHKMWDAFPGMARLINKNHEILAANNIAVNRGFIPGAICAKVGKPESHKGCLMAKALKTREGQFDCPNENLVRGWLPVKGCDDVVVHFSIQKGAEECLMKQK